MTITTKRALTSALCAAGLAALLVLVFRPPLYAPYLEGKEYAAIASGDYSGLHSYYAGRVLHPWVVREVARLLGREPDAAAFRLISDICLFLLFIALGVYFALEECHPLMLLFAATPILIDQYRNYYWPDLFYLTLLLAFILVLRRSLWLSLPIVMALYLTRESTILLVLSLAAVALFHSQKIAAAGTFLAGLLGAWLVSARVSAALPNTHALSVWLLDLLKVPFNFAVNVLGIRLWTNTIAATTLPPVRSFALPVWLRMGKIVEVGYIDWTWVRPVALIVYLASAFGLLPVFLLSGVRARAIRQEKPHYAVSLLFGGLMLIMTPLTGASPERYILYAAPLFWTVLARRMQNWRWQRVLPLAALSLMIAWFPVLVRLAGNRRSAPSLSLLPSNPAQLLVSLVFSTAVWLAASRRELHLRVHNNQALSQHLPVHHQS